MQATGQKPPTAMKSKYLTALVFASLLKISNTSTATTTTTTLGLPTDQVYALFSSTKDIDHDDLKIVMEKGKADEHNLWNTAMGADNVGKVNYFLMMEAIGRHKFKFAKAALNSIISSSDSQTHKENIRAILSWYRSVLEILYKATEDKTFSAKTLAELQAFKNELRDKVYTGEFAPIYEKFVAVSGKSEFTTEDWKFAQSGPYVDLIYIMIHQYFKANGRTSNFHQYLSTLKIYHTRVNQPFLKMLAGMKVPMITGEDDLDIRARLHKFVYPDQKLRADILDMIHFHGFGDENVYMARVGEGTMLTNIVDINRRKYVPAMFMNPSIGLYQSKWILQAIKFAKIDILTIMLEERVPLPTADEIAKALKYKYLGVHADTTIKDLIDLIDSYRKFYDPVTRLCIEGPKFCKPRPTAVEVVAAVPAPRIQSEPPKPPAGTFNHLGEAIADATERTECNPLEVEASLLSGYVGGEGGVEVDSDYEDRD